MVDPFVSCICILLDGGYSSFRASLGVIIREYLFFLVDTLDQTSSNLAILFS